LVTHVITIVIRSVHPGQLGVTDDLRLEACWWRRWSSGYDDYDCYSSSLCLLL